MRRLFGQKNRGQVDGKLLFDIRKELDESYSRPQSEKEFISRSEALRILTRERVGMLFRKTYWYKEDERDDLHPSMCLVICTLITCNFDDWDNFKTIFFNRERFRMNHRLVDDDLPLHDVTWLSDPLRTSFERQQYVFCPIVIERNTHREYDARRRLPIMTEAPISGSGSQGDVDIVEIEKGFLQDDPSTHNSKVRVMARKRITRETRRGQQSFSTEKYNLEQFKHSLLNHSNIMQSYATFVHGPHFVIISEFAEGRDLHQFLYHPDQVFHDYTSRSMRFTPHNLFTEVYSLAGALNFLHHQMGNNRGARYQCAHLDLKPENVLVCISQSDRPADLPVGRWKITDFGLSNVEESVAGKTVVATSPEAEHAGGLAPGKVLSELSIHPLRRGPGPFQPPEVRDSETAKVSTRRDVWSFGCILAMILAFALGGPEQVNLQHQCRSVGADDYFYIRDKNPFRSKGSGTYDAMVKPAIYDWLFQTAPNIAPSHSEWIQHCSRLVLQLLEVDVIKRPEINQAVSDLATLLMYTGRQAQYRVWNFDESTLAPEPVTIIPDPFLDGSTLMREPIMITRNALVAGDATPQHIPGPFVGVRTNSSPSSTAISPSSPSQGTFSFSMRLRPDEASRFINLRTVNRCTSATLCPTGFTAALWGDDMVTVYELRDINDESPFWQSAPSKPSPQSDCPVLRMFCIEPPKHHKYRKVALHGKFLAMITQSEQYSQQHSLHIYYCQSDANRNQYSYSKCITESYTSMPHDIKLSIRGSCLVRFSDNLRHVTIHDFIDIPISDRDVMGFDFTGDGGAFCLWIRDKDHQLHYWTVWNSNLRVLGSTIVTDYPRSEHRSFSQEAFLVPFHSYPRFVACDKYGSVFLVLADSIGERARRLGSTENVFASTILPGDDGFLLVRASEHSKQKLQTIRLSSMGDRASFKPDDRGPLPMNLRKGVCGISVRSYLGEEGSVCVLTLQPNGILTRKILY